MRTTNNSLRQYRKKTYITQFDIAFLLGLDNNSLLSRCEAGERKPSLEMMLVYHLLFNVPITDLFDGQRKETKQMLLSRVADLLKMLKEQEATANTQLRIEHLERTFIRLAKENS